MSSATPAPDPSGHTRQLSKARDLSRNVYVILRNNESISRNRSIFDEGSKEKIRAREKPGDLAERTLLPRSEIFARGRSMESAAPSLIGNSRTTAERRNTSADALREFRRERDEPFPVAHNADGEDGCACSRLHHAGANWLRNALGVMAGTGEWMKSSVLRNSTPSRHRRITPRSHRRHPLRAAGSHLIRTVISGQAWRLNQGHHAPLIDTPETQKSC